MAIAKKTTNTKARTPKSTVASDNSMDNDNNSARFPIIKRVSCKFKDLKLGDNVRQSISPKDVEVLRKSIEENGLITPLQVNQNGVLLDGYTRYAALKDLKQPDDLINCLVRDVPDSEVPLFQYICGLAKGLPKQSNNLAFIRYKNSHPEMSDTAISKIFGVDQTTVSDVIRIHAASPELSMLVADKKVGTNTANTLLDSAKKLTKKPAEITALVAEVTSELTNILNKDEETGGKLKKTVVPKLLEKAVEKLKITTAPVISTTQEAVTNKFGKKQLTELLAALKPSECGKEGFVTVSGDIPQELYRSIVEFLSDTEDKTTNSTDDKNVIEIRQLFVTSFELPSLVMEYHQLAHNNNDKIVILNYQGKYLVAADNAEFWLNHAQQVSKLPKGYEYKVTNVNGISILNFTVGSEDSLKAFIEQIEIDIVIFECFLMAENSPEKALEVESIDNQNPVVFYEGVALSDNDDGIALENVPFDEDEDEDSEEDMVTVADIEDAATEVETVAYGVNFDFSNLVDNLALTGAPDDDYDEFGESEDDEDEYEDDEFLN